MADGSIGNVSLGNYADHRIIMDPSILQLIHAAIAEDVVMTFIDHARADALADLGQMPDAVLFGHIAIATCFDGNRCE